MKHVVVARDRSFSALVDSINVFTENFSVLLYAKTPIGWSALGFLFESALRLKLGVNPG